MLLRPSGDDSMFMGMHPAMHGTPGGGESAILLTSGGTQETSDNMDGAQITRLTIPKAKLLLEKKVPSHAGLEQSNVRNIESFSMKNVF